jgi:hypothetical protein
MTKKNIFSITSIILPEKKTNEYGTYRFQIVVQLMIKMRALGNLLNP